MPVLVSIFKPHPLGTAGDETSIVMMTKEASL